MTEDVRSGTEVAGYRIESQLGRGGMGVVYLAEHLRLGRKVALKILAPELAENEVFRERFIRESRVAASIDHPNIVPIYDADETDGMLFIAMRFVQGTDLRSLLKTEGRLEPVRAARIVAQAADALAAAHARDLVHRDVKPGNILLTSGDHVYLSDFGLTKRALSVSGLTRTGQLVGTIDYVAPEMIKGESVNGRADLYSLGCVLYECLIGHPPYPRDVEVAVLWAHVQEPSPRPTDVLSALPDVLDDIVATALAKRPDERYSTGTEFAADVRAAVGVAPESAVAARRVVGARAHKRARRAWVLFGAVVVLAGAAIASLLLFRPDKEVFVPGTNTVARIDPETHVFERPVDIGRYPLGLAFGDGRVWVVNLESQDVYCVEPVAGETCWSRGVGEDPTGVAAGEGFVWITFGLGGVGQVEMLDPRTRELAPAFDVPSGSQAIAVGGGSVWVADPDAGRVVRYDPVIEQKQEIQLVDDPLAEPIQLLSVAYGGDPAGLWLADALGNRLFRIDPQDQNDPDSYSLRDSPSMIAIVGSEVWVTSLDEDSVTVLDAVTGIPRDYLDLTGDGCNAPTGIAEGADGVWISCSFSSTVLRVDTTSKDVIGRLPVRGSPDAMTPDAEGGVWVAIHEL